MRQSDSKIATGVYFRAYGEYCLVQRGPGKTDWNTKGYGIGRKIESDAPVDTCQLIRKRQESELSWRLPRSRGIDSYMNREDLEILILHILCRTQIAFPVEL
jgi:hypothetical protein